MVLVYGGSFNPPTIAHEAIIQKLYEQFKPKHIVVVPNGNYFSWKTDLIDFDHRYKMVQLMTKELYYVTISDIENTPKFLGSYHTLNQLSKTYKNLYFVVGADHLETFHKWKHYKELINDYKFIVLTRTNYKIDYNKLEKIGLNYELVSFDSPVSSTMVRNHLDQHLNHLNPKVKDYILKHNLYKEVKA